MLTERFWKFLKSLKIGVQLDVQSEKGVRRSEQRQSADISLSPPSPRPYIVYMLHEMDIMEDWTAIKKVSRLGVGGKVFLEGE